MPHVRTAAAAVVAAALALPAGRIGPGEFVDFGLSLRMPKGEAGDRLTFKALQTYEDGEVVRWIGPEDADEPAAIVTLTGASSGGGHGAPGSDPDTAVSSDDAAGAQEPASAPAENASATVEADGGYDALAIAALAVAVVALAAARASFLRRAG